MARMAGQALNKETSAEDGAEGRWTKEQREKRKQHRFNINRSKQHTQVSEDFMSTPAWERRSDEQKQVHLDRMDRFKKQKRFHKKALNSMSRPVAEEEAPVTPDPGDGGGDTGGGDTGGGNNGGGNNGGGNGGDSGGTGRKGKKYGGYSTAQAQANANNANFSQDTVNKFLANSAANNGIDLQELDQRIHKRSQDMYDRATIQETATFGDRDRMEAPVWKQPEDFENVESPDFDSIMDKYMNMIKGMKL